MKSFFLLALPVLLFSLYQQPSRAQSCSGSALFHQGRQFVFVTEMKVFDGAQPGKDINNPDSYKTTKKIRNTYTILSVKNEGGVLMSSFAITKTEILEGDTTKSKAPLSSFLGANCDGQGVTYRVTLKSAMMNATFTIDFPTGMKAGDVFKDKTITMDMPAYDKKKSGPSSITVIVHRKVVGEETVSTPAGKWNCFKIAETNTTQIPGINGKPATTYEGQAPSYTWYAPGMGIIKTSTMNTSTTTLVAMQ